MEPLLIILVPGLLGGLVLAVLIARGAFASARAGGRPLEPPSPTLINMAHIRVEGLGGLGMVTAVVVVALVDPRIRLAIALSALAGAALAVAMIVRRRGSGPLPSGTNHPGAHILLPQGRFDRFKADGVQRGGPGGGGPQRGLSGIRRLVRPSVAG
jgi:hypothetical protein